MEENEIEKIKEEINLLEDNLKPEENNTNKKYSHDTNENENEILYRLIYLYKKLNNIEAEKKYIEMCLKKEMGW